MWSMATLPSSDAVAGEEGHTCVREVLTTLLGLWAVARPCTCTAVEVDVP
jgi:hypothetical protein